MPKLIITYNDYINCTITGLNMIDKNIVYKAMRVFIPSARYQASYKLGRWDGYKNYFNIATGKTYVNLIPQILDLVKYTNYEIEYVYPDNLLKEPNLGDLIDESFFGDLKWYEGHFKAGELVRLDDHQVRAVNACLQNPRSIMEAATGAGKTLMSAVLCKKVLEHGKMVLIVPGKDLCFQTAQELKFFGLDTGIVGCNLREFGHDVTVCTWQTINSLERSKEEKPLTAEELSILKKDVIGLIFDECHQCKSYHIQQILGETFRHIPIKWGLTGTVPKEKSDYFCLITSLGPVSSIIESKELQDKGFLAESNIYCIKLKDETKFIDYPSEVEYLSTNENRLNFIADFIEPIVKNKGNTLVLLNRITMGKILEEKLIQRGVDAIFLSGEVKTKKRFEHYNSIKTENNKCILATAQIASTGLNIPRLFNLVLLDIGKSFTRVIQSIGRGLRLAKDKDKVDVFDITSDTKFSKRHLNERIKYYNEQKHNLNIFNIDKWFD